MRIDLRYPIVIAAFYAPGLMLLIGAWLLGYSTVEVREAVAFAGSLLGLGGIYPAIIVLFLSDHARPIWLHLGKRRISDDDNRDL